MSKIAIDVVLLPSEEMMDKTIEINKELLKTFSPKTVLDKQKCIPHISLCMGCIDEKDIPSLQGILDRIAKEFISMNLVAEALESEVIPNGKVFSGIKIKNIKELQVLHEKTMQGFWNFLSYEVESSMISNPAEIEDITLHWIEGYKKKYDNPSLFHPHITIGHGETNKFNFPINFKASKIAVCHLGNYCTCRKVIISSDLQPGLFHAK